MNYRALPVVVEAVQFTEDNATELVRWATSFSYDVMHQVIRRGPRNTIEVMSIDGTMAARVGER